LGEIKNNKKKEEKKSQSLLKCDLNTVGQVGINAKTLRHVPPVPLKGGQAWTLQPLEGICFAKRSI